MNFHQTKEGEEDRLNAIYLKEDWGKLLKHLGRNPYHTESVARSVAEESAKIIRELRRLLIGAKFSSREVQKNKIQAAIDMVAFLE